MKKNIFKTLAATVCFAALVLTGCVNNFEGTTRNYKQKAEQQTGNFGPGKTAKGLDEYNIKINNLYYYEDPTITIAKEDTELTVSISSCQFELDLDSSEKALTFYKLKKNKVERYYPEHDGEITKTLLHVTEPSSFSGTYSFLYRLDLKTVTTNQIALVVDATKLKYKNGLSVISTDGNLKAGEETDSFVEYIYVTYKSDGEETDVINNIYKEDYSPVHQINYLSEGYYGSLGNELTVSDTDLTPSGKFRYYCYAPVKTMDAGGNVDTRDDSLEEILSKKFKLQIQEPNTTKWKDGSKLEFAYHTDYASYSTKPSNPYSSYTYTTDVDTSTMAQGTKWRIVCDYSVSIGKAPDYILEVYGHPAFVYDKKYTEVIYEGFKDYGDKDTTYIYAWGNSGTPGTFNKDGCDYMAAFFTQSDFVNWIETNEHSIEINFKTWLAELVNTDGFILVDSKKTIVPSTTTVHKNGEGKIDKVIITPNNDKLNLNRDSYDVYVGSGTTIKENPDYPKQVQFGCYPDQSMGPLSGYVLLAQNIVKNGTAYNTADDWQNGQVDSFWINEDNYGRNNSNSDWENHFNGNRKVYLIAGKTYNIQFVNGYGLNPNRDLFLTGAQNSGWRPNLCYYGKLYLIDADEDTWSTKSYKAVLDYNDSSESFTCNKTGYYYICTNRDSTASIYAQDDEYDPFTESSSSLSYELVRRDWYWDAYCNWDGSDYVGWVDNPYYNENDASYGPDGWDDIPLLYNYSIDTSASPYDIITDTIGTYSHKIINNPGSDDDGLWAINPNRCIPYRWGNVYYHIYMQQTP